MNGHDEMRDDVAALALGVLPADRAAAVRSHLQSCDACRSEFADFTDAVTAIGYAQEATADRAPGPLLKARIMREVRAGTARSRRPVAVWPAYAAAAACIVIAVGFGLQNRDLHQTVAASQRQASAQAGELARERAVNLREQRMVADLTASDARRYPFEHGMVVTRGTHVYMAMRGTQLPPGRVYQAWTLSKGAKTVRPSVTFNVNERSMTTIEIPAAAQSLAMVAVSVEPAGGSAQPTTKPVAVIKLNS